MERGPKPAGKLSRRELLRQGAVATGVVWTAPVILSLRTPAFAQYGCEAPDCTYTVHFDEEPFVCTECQNICGYVPCGDCPGPACDRITSVSKRLEGGLRFCTDCVLHECVMDTVCWCPEEELCECLMAWNIDPSDPRCGLVAPGHQDQCDNNAWEIHFACVQ